MDFFFSKVAPIWLFTLEAGIDLSAERISTYLSLALVGSVKFVISAVMALLAGLNFWEMFISTTVGAIIGVWILTYFGTQIRVWIDKLLQKNKAHKVKRRNPYVLYVWDKFGLLGVSFLAPLLSPPVSVAVAVSFRENPQKVVLYMSISLVFWSIIFFLFQGPVLVFREFLIALAQSIVG